MSVKMGKYEFQASWICFRARFRLSAGRVFDDGALPVVSVNKKWAMCRIPKGYVGQRVGVLDCTSTNVFAIGGGDVRLLCHLFAPDAPHTESKHPDRTLAFVFGENPHAQDTKTREIFGFDELNDSYFSHDPATFRQIDHKSGAFRFGFLIHPKSPIKDIANPALEKSFAQMRALDIPVTKYSSVILSFDLRGAFIGSDWIIKMPDKTATWSPKVFPFIWDHLVEVPD